MFKEHVKFQQPENLSKWGKANATDAQWIDSDRRPINSRRERLCGQAGGAYAGFPIGSLTSEQSILVTSLESAAQIPRFQKAAREYLAKQVDRGSRWPRRVGTADEGFQTLFLYEPLVLHYAGMVLHRHPSCWPQSVDAVLRMTFAKPMAVELGQSKRLLHRSSVRSQWMPRL